MKFKIFLNIIIIISTFLVLSIFVQGETINEVNPTIAVTFKEPVKITSATLKETLTNRYYNLQAPVTTDNKKFLFKPILGLKNGNYVFEIYAQDLVGNKAKYQHTFTVYVPEAQILLLKPNSIGVSNNTVFDIVAKTTKPAHCRYTSVIVANFSDIKLKEFDKTGNYLNKTFVSQHTILKYSVTPSFPQDLYVVCMDDLKREFAKKFKIYADTTDPTPTLITFSPSKIVEYPPTGDIKSKLTVVSDEPVICKYSDNSTDTYEKMKFFKSYTKNTQGLPAFNSYNSTNSVDIKFPSKTVKGAFAFYVQCEDRSGRKTKKSIKKIDMDLSTGLQILVKLPVSSSKNTTVAIDLITNKRSYCMYKTPKTQYTDSGAALSSQSSLTTSHKKYLGTYLSGKHTLSFYCVSPEGVGTKREIITKDYPFLIDTVPPTTPIITVPSDVCARSVTAKFKANDSESGVAYYSWTFGSTSKTIASGNTSANSVTVSKDNNGSSLNLTSTDSYLFKAFAVDSSGNKGRTGISSTIKFDATKKKCDKTPPIVTLNVSTKKDFVTINCKDDVSSKCFSFAYNTVYSGSCNATVYKFPPFRIPLFKTTIICWYATDESGNIAKGAKTVTVTVNSTAAEKTTTCQIDNDKDGYGLGTGCLGKDCDDTNYNISIGCTTGCVSDMDGDSYGLGCINGKDCNDMNKNQTTICLNGCIADHDGDSYGLGCSAGPDCNGMDPTYTISCSNGCKDDNDGDQYGINCPAGYDCNGENNSETAYCANNCIQDTDGDSYGFGCIKGLDCNGIKPTEYTSCSNGCVSDEDGDFYGLGCTNGLDCNGLNKLTNFNCSNGCLVDEDGDGYGWGCPNKPDCNDTNPLINLDCTLTSNCVLDLDGDGYGLGCSLGADCNDYSKNLTKKDCVGNCSFDIDCDSLPDKWQLKFFNSSKCNQTKICGPLADPDGDGLTNIQEYRRGSDPLKKSVSSKNVTKQVIEPKLVKDKDGDGMLDSCEVKYGFSPSDPYDGDKDKDGDTISNKDECNYPTPTTACLNPTKKDTDSDGYDDNVEIDKKTNPCSATSKPASYLLNIILIVLGLLFLLGSTGYLIYKNYYLPLVAPPPPKPVMQRRPAPMQRQTPRPQRVIQSKPKPAIRFKPKPVIIPKKKPSGPKLSKHLFRRELAKRKAEREKMFSSFGEKKSRPKEIVKIKKKEVPKKVVNHIEKQTKTKEPENKIKKEDHFDKLNNLLKTDSVDKLDQLSKKEVDHFEKLATIVKQKEGKKLGEDYVDRLANVTKQVSDDKKDFKKLENAMKQAETDKLTDFLNSRQHVGTFVKNVKKQDSVEDLKEISNDKKDVFEGLSNISKKKRG